MENLLSNSRYKYIQFPAKEYKERFNQEQQEFSRKNIIEFAVGGFCSLITASEIYPNIEIIPSWKDSEVAFIYELRDFEVDYLEKLPEKERLELLKQENYTAGFDLIKDNDKKRIKGDISVDFSSSLDTEIKDIKLAINIKLTLQKEYEPSLESFSSSEELNKRISSNINELYQAIWSKLEKLFKENSSITSKTISFVPDYLRFATAPVMQEFRRLLTVNKNIFEKNSFKIVKQQKIEQYTFNYEPNIEQITGQILNLNDLTVDVLNGLVHLWLEKKKNNSDPVLISVDDLLFIRGRKANPNKYGERGGYKDEARQEISKQIELLSNINIKVENMYIPEIDAEGKRVYNKWSGESSAIVSSKWQKEDNKGNKSYYYLIRPGDVLKLTLVGLGTKTGIIHRKIAEYDPYRHIWEKRIGNYLAWIWRNRQNKGDYLTPLSIDSLIKEVKEDLNTQRPNDIRIRLEKALEQLADDAVIKSWQYESINEEAFSSKGWLNEWLKLKVIIEPPQEIFEEYSKIRRIKPAKTLTDHKLDLELLKTIMKEKNINQLQLSEIVNILPGTLSRILSGKNTPGAVNFNKLKKWLDSEK